MSDYEQHDQVECPKCGYWSPNVEVCESCGALISKVRSRSLSEPETWSEEPERVISQEVVTGPREVGSSWPLMVVLIGAVGVGSFFAYKMGKLPFISAPPAPAEMSNAPVEMAVPAPGFKTIAAVAAESEKQMAKMADPAATPESPAASKLLGILANSFVTDPAGSKGDMAPTPAIMSRGGAAVEGPSQANLISSSPRPPVSAVTAVTESKQAPVPSPSPSPARQVAASGPGKARFSTRANPIMIEIGEEQFQTGSYAPSASPPKPRRVAAEEIADETPAPDVAEATPPAAPAAGPSLVSVVDRNSFRQEVLQHSGGPVLVDFFATWCGPCKQLAPTVEAAAQHYNGRMKVVKLDIDLNRDLTEKYEVKSFPTLLMFKNGREIDRAVGAISAPELQQVIEKNL